METIEWIIVCAVVAFIGYAAGGIIWYSSRTDEDEKLIRDLIIIIAEYEEEINKTKSNGEVKQDETD